METSNGPSPAGKATQQSRVRRSKQAKAKRPKNAPVVGGLGADVAGPDEALMTADDVAALLRITRAAVYARSDRGQFPKIKIGGSVRFRRGDLLAFIAAGRAPSPRSTR